MFCWSCSSVLSIYFPSISYVSYWPVSWSGSIPIRKWVNTQYLGNLITSRGDLRWMYIVDHLCLAHSSAFSFNMIPECPGTYCRVYLFLSHYSQFFTSFPDKSWCNFGCLSVCKGIDPLISLRRQVNVHSTLQNCTHPLGKRCILTKRVLYCRFLPVQLQSHAPFLTSLYNKHFDRACSRKIKPIGDKEI